MPAAWSALALAPLLGFLAIMYAAHPRIPVAGPLRRGAALATGTFAVLTVEALGVLNLLTEPAVGLA